jgi:hypothetical protein
MKLVDRVEEQAKFYRLIELDDEARLLTLEDGGGQGKSSLLKSLKRDCVARPTPVSLIALDGLQEHTPLAFVKALREDLRDFDLPFTEFDALEAERFRRTPPADLSTYTGTVDASNATVHPGGIVGGLVYNAPEDADARWLTADELEILGRKMIQTFFGELAQYCDQELVVVLVDGFEACGETLEEWLLNYFLNWYCFQLDRRPQRLAVVVAGRRTPDLSFLGEDRYGRLVVPIPALSPLEAEHVRELYTSRGVEPTPEEVVSLGNRLQQGLSVKVALQIIDLIKQGSGNE